MRHWVFGAEQALDHAGGKQLTSAGKHSEQRGVSDKPAQRPLEHGDAQTAPDQVAGRQRGQRPVLVQIGAQQRGARADARIVEQRPHEGRRQTHDSDRVADCRKGRGDPIEAARIG